MIFPLSHSHYHIPHDIPIIVFGGESHPNCWPAINRFMLSHLQRHQDKRWQWEAEQAGLFTFPGVGCPERVLGVVKMIKMWSLGNTRSGSQGMFFKVILGMIRTLSAAESLQPHLWKMGSMTCQTSGGLRRSGKAATSD
jgi:hypothetical protein